MPVTLSFDIKAAPPAERNRLQSMFERLGWENLGGSSYRYPPLGEHPKAEDWFNRVIPALMLFRQYMLKSGRRLSRFTLDVQSSTGYRPGGDYVTRPRKGAKVKLTTTRQSAFGAEMLREWLDRADWPY